MMDSEASIASEEVEGGCCDCSCKCNLKRDDGSVAWFRSVKRKFEELEEGEKFVIPGLSYPTLPVARVLIENECTALREMVTSQQETIQDLLADLEEERNAAASAANEAMSMIVRLQREKAEIQMESRQFKRFAEEKMAHDQLEFGSVEDLLYKREQAIQALTCEVQAYKHRMMSFGLTEFEIEGERIANLSPNASVKDGNQFDFPAYDYPPLKCSLNEVQGPDGDDDIQDVEKYVFGETPRSEDHLRNLDHRISEMEKSPRSPINGDFTTSKHILEKVTVGQSPRRSRHSRKFSTDSSGSLPGQAREIGAYFITESPKLGTSFKKMEYISQVENLSNRRDVDEASDIGDDSADRICTIDSIHNRAPYANVVENKAGIGVCEDYLTTPRESMNNADIGDPEIKKLYMRLHALEADRESMKQAIISMRTDKAQLVLLREIAQQLCKEMSPDKRAPVKKAHASGNISFMFVFKWITSFILWRKKACQSKYMFGRSSSNAGLLMLLDNETRTRPWRCISSTQL
uniref:GTD-binding domain-containing protein n=1 Tax=Kalanchoe fedtschenkoi TaxID=63787 RepID=A0A7N0V3G4_KALFE